MTGDGVKQCGVGRPTILTLASRNFRGEPVTVGGADVAAYIRHTGRDSMSPQPHSSSSSLCRSPLPSWSSPMSRSPIPSTPPLLRCPLSLGGLQQPTVTDLGNGLYEIVYCVHQEGTYSLDIRIFGEHVRSSPFNVSKDKNQ